MLNAPLVFHVGVNEFKFVGLLPFEYRVEQLKLGHMYNSINGNATYYLRANIDMVRNQNEYSTRASDLSCVIPRVNGSGRTSFLHTSLCLWNNLPLQPKNVAL